MKRIQRKREAGWKLPPNTAVITRPTKFGNPFTAEKIAGLGFHVDPAAIKESSVRMFRQWLGPCWWEVWCGPESIAARKRILESLDELRGKDLACFCKEGDVCHGDILIELCKSMPQHNAFR